MFIRKDYRKMNEDDNFCEGEEKRSHGPLFSCKNDVRHAGKRNYQYVERAAVCSACRGHIKKGLIATNEHKNLAVMKGTTLTQTSKTYKHSSPNRT